MKNILANVTRCNNVAAVNRITDWRNQINKYIHTMRTYEEYVAAVIRYFNNHGKTQEVINKVESMLPGAWAAEIIADALDAI